MLSTEIPEKARFLYEPHPYKVLYGGRGGIKSWSIADALVLQGSQRPLRWLCTRETQNTIEESVHALLSARIAHHGLGRFYDIQQRKIISRVFTEREQEPESEASLEGRCGFSFAGLKHNATGIKSYESYDGAWVEEAQAVTKSSWDILLPTIRKKDSEIWVSFNPELDTDDTYYRWVLNPPPGTVVVKTTWRDNPWFHETTMPALMEHQRLTDPKAYRNIWEGETIGTVDGAVYGDEIRLCEEENRITAVPYDRTVPVHTFWDLGYGDATAIWFAQAGTNGTYRIIDYLEDHGQTIAHYIIQLQQKAYVYGEDWLPHDGIDTILHGRLAGDRTRSIEQLMRAAGRNVRIAPKMLVTTGINAARTIFGQCWFDLEKCADGLQGLRHYQWKPVTAGGIEQLDPQGRPLYNREPLHDWASHPADGFRTLAVSIKQPKTPAPRIEKPKQTYTAWS